MTSVTTSNPGTTFVRVSVGAIVGVKTGAFITTTVGSINAVVGVGVSIELIIIV